ncbi:unnamed protein product [Rangifer tarandus platyrhynchus]|uniref:Uncharacterized protein n=2 Tax=Rangifer tarandus platyrhynchus TaxID=3082113 RepID=A0ACB0F612_RANTA|nr:unnamed protein product [Rangifer tarandus platyrhynchus]CAI9708277.1 unnamed protein product [Rangifer tarandus platyrhynchus]
MVQNLGEAQTSQEAASASRSGPRAALEACAEAWRRSCAARATGGGGPCGDAQAQTVQCEPLAGGVNTAYFWRKPGRSPASWARKMVSSY